MSKWKDKEIKIVQLVADGVHFATLFGLGNDGKVYKWDIEQGAWLKYCMESDQPE